MAGNFQFATGFAPLEFAASGGINPLYPLHRLRRPHAWQRSAILGSLYIDAGAAVSPLAFFLDGINFQSYALDYANTPTSWTAHGSQACAYDDQLGRRKHYRQFVPGTFRYFRVTPGTLDAGETVALVGTALLATTVLTFSSNPSWPESETLVAVTRLPYLGGGEESNEEGKPRLQLTLSAETFLNPATAQSELGQLLAVPAHQPIVFYENMDETQYGYCLQRVEGTVTATERFTTQAVDRIVLREFEASGVNIIPGTPGTGVPLGTGLGEGGLGEGGLGGEL